MVPRTKLEDKLKGIENYRVWKYRIGLILKVNDLEKYIEKEVAEPDEAEAKEKHKKYLIRAQRIIANSIKHHLIPQVLLEKPTNKASSTGVPTLSMPYRAISQSTDPGRFYFS